MRKWLRARGEASLRSAKEDMVGLLFLALIGGLAWLGYTYRPGLWAWLMAPTTWDRTDQLLLAIFLLLLFWRAKRSG